MHQVFENHMDFETSPGQNSVDLAKQHPSCLAINIGMVMFENAIMRIMRYARSRDCTSSEMYLFHGASLSKSAETRVG